MVNRIAFACCLSFLVATACSSEVRQRKETEYLRTQPGKPLVYPEGLDRPVQEKTFVIPELPGSQPASQPPELLALPPRLSGVDVSEDEDAQGEDSGDDSGEVKPGDDGFIATPIP